MNIYLLWYTPFWHWLLFLNNPQILLTNCGQTMKSPTNFCLWCSSTNMSSKKHYCYAKSNANSFIHVVRKPMIQTMQIKCNQLVFLFDIAKNKGLWRQQVQLVAIVCSNGSRKLWCKLSREPLFWYQGTIKSFRYDKKKKRKEKKSVTGLTKLSK